MKSHVILDPNPKKKELPKGTKPVLVFGRLFGYVGFSFFVFRARRGAVRSGNFRKRKKHVEHGTNDLRLVSFASAVIMILRLFNPLTQSRTDLKTQFLSWWLVSTRKT